MNGDLDLRRDTAKTGAISPWGFLMPFRVSISAPNIQSQVSKQAKVFHSLWTPLTNGEVDPTEKQERGGKVLAVPNEVSMTVR